MRVLLTESAPGAAGESEQRLRDAGYDLSFCHPDQRADEDECVVFRGIGHCPLRTDPDIGVVVDVRAADAPAMSTAREFGTCCALRNHVPLVVAGPAPADRFPWSDAAVLCTPEEVPGVCERLTRPVDEEIARDAERVASDALRANGFDGRVEATVANAAGSTAVFLHVPGLSDGFARAEAAGLVRETLKGRKGEAEVVTVMTVARD